MGTFNEARKDRAERYLAREVEILAAHFGHAPEEIRQATFAEDTTEATDLVLPDGTRIAKRVRQPHQLRHYGDVIFRHPPKSVGKSEWEKIIEGKADYCLYSIALDETELACWWLLNLEAIRAADRRGWTCTKMPEYHPNGDDDGFVVVKLDGFPSRPPLVVASSEPPVGNTDGCGRCREMVA